MHLIYAFWFRSHWECGAAMETWTCICTIPLLLLCNICVIPWSHRILCYICMYIHIDIDARPSAPSPPPPYILSILWYNPALARQHSYISRRMTWRTILIYIFAHFINHNYSLCVWTTLAPFHYICVCECVCDNWRASKTIKKA